MKFFAMIKMERGTGSREQGAGLAIRTSHHSRSPIPHSLFPIPHYLIIILFLLCAITANAQTNRPWWYSLEEGKALFSSGSYGDALMAFEDARRNRVTQFTRMEQDFITLLSNPSVRRLGDSLDFLEKYIADNNETAAAAALAELYYRVPKDSLKGSAKRALEEFDQLKNYPEAEYWLGETYKAEGELSLALRQFERAWGNRAFLETPGFDTEILYRITDIHRIRREYQEMEKRANEIIEGADSSGVPRDSLWTGNRIRAAMARVLENEGVNRFLSLYRHDNTLTERAHRLMGFFCYASNRYSLAAEYLMFAFLIQNTVLIDEAIRTEFDYSFTSLEDLAVYVRSKPGLTEYLEETEYYRTIYYLASALFANGKTRPARELWAFLAGSANAGEWGNRARRNPSPFLDRAIEMP